MTWDQKFLAMAVLIATWSKDPSTKVGAVIVNPDAKTIVSTGYNGMPRKVDDRGKHPGDPIANSRWFRPQKYKWVEHAERNAIYNAARIGKSTEGCWLYLNWTPQVCADCARAIIQAGICRVIGTTCDFPGKGELWKEHDIVASVMLQEARVGVETIE